MDDLDNILTNIDLEEEKLETEEKDWYCNDCEHGPMMDGGDMVGYISHGQEYWKRSVK